MDEIAEMIGVRPQIARLALRHPRLALKCFFGPCTPVQYRLQGPGQWAGARDYICKSFTNSVRGLKKRTALTQEANSWTKEIVFAMFVMFFTIVLHYYCDIMTYLM